MRELVAILLSLGLAAASLTAARAEADPCEGVVCAGFARVDITWHVSGAQGQYSDTGNALLDDRFDPYAHNVHTKPQDGLHSRSYARAFVVQGPDGRRVAYVGHDLYLQQDTLTRRVAQMVEAADVGIDRSTLMIQASHNHSATSLASTAWGVWVFTDVMDARFFDFVSERLTSAVVDAASELRPVRVGASVSLLDEVQQNILGPAVGDDGTPAGFPRDHFDRELAVVRFDDVSDPSDPRPLGMLVNLGMHPESLDTTGMPSADFVGQVEAVVARQTGASVSWSQGAVGDVEPDRDARAHPPEQKREYWHRDFAQMEEMSRIVADRVVDTWRDVAAGTPELPDRYVPFSTVFDVDMVAARFAGPASHPAPTVSNCRTEASAGGEVGIPVLGFPDCERVDGPDVSPVYEGADAIAPLPANYGAPGYGGAQEALNVHLQVMRLGEILLATCPCEPITDMVRNFKSRANPSTEDMELGYLWPCEPKDAQTYVCDFRSASYRAPDLREIPAERYERMYAQIHNDAAGWDAEDPESIARAEHEPDDPAQIKGNFTHSEIQDLGTDGYTLPLMVGQANDYVGYIVTYREYESHDHYRKALTAFGPHSADYVNTRLVAMAAMLRGADVDLAELGDVTVTAEDAAAEARARALGEGAAAATEAYEATLPDDGGEPTVIASPPDVAERFSGVQVRWVGGSNYTDNPRVRVTRLPACPPSDPPVPCAAPADPADWPTFATQDGGEVVTNVAYAPLSDPSVVAGWVAGEHVWQWTASFEVLEDTPPGSYAFVIDGEHRSGGAPLPYTLVEGFEVRPWSGIQVTDGDFDPDTGVASFTVAPVDYPDTWPAEHVPYISTATTDTNTGTYCLRCTFRPWADTGEVAHARVTVTRASGAVETFDASFDGERWVATGIAVDPEDVVFVEAGDVTDGFGNTNGVGLHLFGPLPPPDSTFP